MIEVRLFATFREGRDKIIHLPEEGHPDAGSVIDALGIPRGEVAILLVNGQHSKPKTPVKTGDVVALFPPVGGG
ncbi:MoaD/ThiS family protein [Ruminococcaceae bacterium OttesenSCG-928-A11]|nr:MoaD/ThiS family protein [Ruminococcaceae bacterium OttesenSCG-928-A11]